MRRSDASDMCNSLKSLPGVESSVSVTFALILAIPDLYSMAKTDSISMLNVFMAKALSMFDEWNLHSREASFAAQMQEPGHA